MLAQHRTPRDSNSSGVLIPPETLRKALSQRRPGRNLTRRSLVALTLPDPFKERPNRRPIRRAFTSVMQGHPPHWVHENVPSQLIDVAGGASEPMPSPDQSSVRPPGRGPPDRPPPTTSHAIGAIEDTLPVDQQGPRETHLADVLFGTLPSLERYDYDAQAQPGELALPLSQLRQVLPTG